MATLPPLTGAPSRETILRSIDGVPWDYLAHAYAAATDAPEELTRFIEAGPDDVEAAVEWMWASILHQGNIYSASPPAMWILADLVAADPDHPAADAILNGLGTLAEACGYFSEQGVITEPLRRSAPGEPAWEVWVPSPIPNGEPGDEYFAACAVSLNCMLDTVAHAAPVVSHCLDHPDPRIRQSAAGAWWHLVAARPSTAMAKDRLREMIGNALERVTHTPVIPGARSGI